MNVSKFIVNKLKLVAVIVLIAAISIGCKDKYTTVADDITSEDGSSQYVEMGKFELKPANDSDREDIGYCAILIPSGFRQSESVPGLYVSNIYPLDSSNIYYTVSKASDVGAVDNNLTKEDYKATIEAAYAKLGRNLSLTVDEFSKEDIQGIPGFKIRSHYELEGTQVQQLVYIILASDTHVITYTQMDDDELMADFMVAEGEIMLVRERSQA